MSGLTGKRPLITKESSSVKFILTHSALVIQGANGVFGQQLLQYLKQQLSKHRKIKDPRTKEIYFELEAGFYFSREEGGEVRVPASCFNEVNNVFRSTMGRSIPDDMIIKQGLNPGLPAAMSLDPRWTLKDYQEDFYDWFSKLEGPVLNDFPPGKGKTVTAVTCLVRKGRRMLLLMTPRLMDKWEADLKGSDEKMPLIDISKTELGIIKTIKDLIRWMERYKERPELGPGVILLSNAIYKIYLRDYRQLAILDFDEIYPIRPGDLDRLLGIGALLIDEVHEQFNANFIAQLFFNCQTHIGLSGSLLPNGDTFIDRFQRYYFPHPQRYGKIKPDRFANVVAILYNIDRIDRFRIRVGMNYNHAVFEQSLLKSKKHTNDYMTMIRHYLETAYIKRRVESDRCLIYVSSIELATLLTEDLTKRYPELSIARYVADDPYENVIKPDIRISTPGKCRSAIDIPQLTTILNTCAIKADTSNVQMLGRGRELEDKEVYYIYFTCEAIKKHLEYHRSRWSLYQSRIKKQNMYRYPVTIGLNVPKPPLITHHHRRIN